MDKMEQIEKIFARLQMEGDKYRISNTRLLAVCEEVERAILDSTPDNFTCKISGEFGVFEIRKFEGYDAGIWRSFRYIKFNDEVLTEVWFNDVNVGTLCGSRAQRIIFLKNIDKILEALIAKLHEQNIQAESALNRIKIETPVGEQ